MTDTNSYDCICPVCHKEFYISDKTQWVYKREQYVNGRKVRHYFCRYNCMCEFDKKPRDYKKLNAVISAECKGYIELIARTEDKLIGEVLDDIIRERMVTDAEEE